MISAFLLEFLEVTLRLRTVHKPNGGVFSVRNLGLDYAKDEYICFVDPDDFLDHDYVSFHHQIINEYLADISSCGYYIKREENTYPGEGFDEVYFLDRWAAVKKCIDGGLFGYMCIRFFSRVVLEGVRFDERVKISEDQLFNFSAYKRRELNSHWETEI